MVVARSYQILLPKINFWPFSHWNSHWSPKNLRTAEGMVVERKQKLFWNRWTKWNILKPCRSWNSNFHQNKNHPNGLQSKCQRHINVKCQMSWHINVKCQMSNVKCQMSNVKCQMSNVKCQMSCHIHVKCHVIYMSNVKCHGMSHVKVKCQM